MNLREKFIWNISLTVASLAILISMFNFFQIGTSANEYYDRFKNEEVGTDKELENKVMNLENNYKFRERRN